MTETTPDAPLVIQLPHGRFCFGRARERADHLPQNDLP
jgi:hypothetical protein